MAALTIQKSDFRQSRPYGSSLAHYRGGFRAARLNHPFQKTMWVKFPARHYVCVPDEATA